MRLNWAVLILMIISPVLFGTENANPAGSKQESKAPDSIVFLMSRAIDASTGSGDKWIAALIEAVFEFKFAAIDGFVMVHPDIVRRNMPEHADLSKVPSNSRYLETAGKLRADYAGIQKFELSGKDIFYYLEITSVKDKKLVGTVELEFKIVDLGSSLDRIIEMILKELKITPQKELARFMRMPAIGNKLRNIKRLGEIVISERFTSGSDPQTIAQEYRSVCDADQSLLVGFYRAGMFFESIGKPNEASQAFNLLFMSLPEYLPIYIPLARNFRKARQYEDAVRIAMLGEQRGIKSTELISEKAMALEKLGKVEDAEKAYKAILEKNSNDPYALLYYARKNNDEGKAKPALEYSQRLLKINSASGLANMERGRSLMLLSQKTEAIKAFNKAIESMPNDPDPYIYLGDLYCEMGKYEDAFALYSKILKGSDNIDLYIKAANACEKAGDSKKALNILKPMESRYSNHGGLQRELGLLELANGDTVKAKSLLEASIRSNSENESVLMALGWIYNAAADYEKAIKMFTLAMSKTKNKSKAKLGMAMVFIRQGNSSSAITLLKEVSPDDLNEPGMNRLLGDSFFSNGEKKKALDYYKKERKYAASDTVLQARIATLAYETGTTQEARIELEKLVKMGAGGSNALYHLGVLSLRLKDTKGAESYFAKAEIMGKADADTYYLIGKECAKLGMSDRAVLSFESCLKLNPSKDSAWVMLTEILEKTGKDSAAAEAHLKLYLIDKTKYSRNLAIAGKKFEKAGLKDKAKNAYAMFIQNRHSDPEVNVRLAFIEAESKNYKRVIDLLKDLQPSQINTNEALILAEAYCYTNQYEPAIKHLDYVLKTSPQNVRAVELSAVANDKTNNTDKAILMYRKYLQTSKEPNGEYAFRLAFLYEQKKDMKNALDQYARNIKSFSDDYRNYDRIARLYAESGKWKLAVPMLEKALAFKEASQDLNELLAKGLASTGDGAQAVESYKNYLQKSPKDSTAWIELGELYFNQKKYIEAAQSFEKALSIMRRNFGLFKKTGISYVNAGQHSKAAEALKNAFELNNNDIETITLLADCYREIKAVSYLTNLLIQWTKIDPKNFEIRKELGELLLAQSKTADAAVILEEAVLLKNCADGIHVTLTEIYEKLGMEDKKVYHLQAALNCSPRDPELTYKIALYFYNRKDYVKAREYLNKTVSLSSKHAEANYLLGACLLMENKAKQATTYFSRAVNSDPQNMQYRLALAEGLYGENKIDKALEIVRPVVLQQRPEPAALRLAGLLFKAMGQSDTAKQILRDAVAANSDCFECVAALGDLYFDEAQYREASKYYQTAINKGGYSQDAAIKLARSYHFMGDFDRSRKIYTEILKNDPDNGEALYRLAHWYIKNNQLDEAKRLVIGSKTKTGWHFLIDGEISEAEKNMNSAVVAYSKALKMIPEVPEVQAAGGRISLAKRKFSAAVIYFGKAMAGDPENTELFLNLGMAYEGSNDYLTALELYKEVMRREPNNDDVYYYMARICSKQKNHQEAIQYLQEGIRRNKKSETLYMVLGHEYRSLKNLNMALDSYFKAVRLDEEQNKEAYRYIGNIYYLKKDEKNARRYFEKYISVGGQNADKVEKILKRL